LRRCRWRRWRRRRRQRWLLVASELLAQLARAIGTAKRALVDVHQSDQDLPLLHRATRGDVQLSLQHVGEALEVAGLGGHQLQRLQRLDRRRRERERALEQHPGVGGQRQPLAQDAGGGDQRRRSLLLGGPGPRVVRRRDQRPRRRVRIAAPRVQLDQPPPGGAHRRARAGVVDAQPQRRQRAFFVVRRLARQRQLVRQLRALVTGRGGVDRAPQGRQLPLRSPAKLDAARRHGHRLEAQVAAGRQPPAPSDQDLVQRRLQGIDVDGGAVGDDGAGQLARGGGDDGGADRRDGRRGRAAGADVFDGDAQHASFAGGEHQPRLELRVATGGGDLAGDRDAPVVQRDGEARDPAGGDRHLGQPAIDACDARPVDQQVRGQQPAAPPPQAVGAPVTRQLGHLRPLDLHPFDDGRAQIAAPHGQSRSTVRDGERHRHVRVGHAAASSRAVGCWRKARS
jgi:hypothetical protein